MPNKQQGQIWWADLPDPLSCRPVLILIRSDVLSRLYRATVAPLTKTIRGIESEVILESDDGVLNRCAETLDNIATVEQDLFVSWITSLSADQMNAVWEALHYAFDLPYWSYRYPVRPKNDHGRFMLNKLDLKGILTSPNP